MYKLALLLILLCFPNCKIKTAKKSDVFVFKSRHHKMYVNLSYRKDTTDVEIFAENIHIRSPFYTLKIIKDGKAEHLPFGVLRLINGKQILMPIRTPEYFSNRSLSIKAAYNKMVEEPTALILNKKYMFHCLAAFELQQNNYNGLIKLTYVPSYGICRLFVNNGGEDTDATFAEDFSLISVNGDNPNNYLNKICR